MADSLFCVTTMSNHPQLASTSCHSQLLPNECHFLLIRQLCCSLKHHAVAEEPKAAGHRVWKMLLHFSWEKIQWDPNQKALILLGFITDLNPNLPLATSTHDLRGGDGYENGIIPRVISDGSFLEPKKYKKK